MAMARGARRPSQASAPAAFALRRLACLTRPACPAADRLLPIMRGGNSGFTEVSNPSERVGSGSPPQARAE
jgi:hypothetical protein